MAMGCGTQQHADYAAHISEEQENAPSKQVRICAAKKELNFLLTFSSKF